MNSIGASAMEVSPSDYLVSKEWTIHKQDVYIALWQHKSSFPWEFESYTTFAFENKKHRCVSLAHKITDTCNAAILLFVRWKNLEKIEEWGWIGLLNREKPSW